MQGSRGVRSVPPDPASAFGGAWYAAGGQAPSHSAFGRANGRNQPRNQPRNQARKRITRRYVEPVAWQQEGKELRIEVHLTRFKLNARLAKHLQEPWPAAGKSADLPTSLPSYHAARWRLRDRLSKEQIAELVVTSKSGTPTRALAARYGIDVRSVRKLLREEGVKPRSWRDIQP